MQSLQNTCQQALYSVERLELFCNQETSNTFAFYVTHHIYDFLARVETATDLLALIINHIFELGLPDKKCNLEDGSFVGKLRASKPNDQHVERLARDLDRTRNNWLAPFYELRNVVIHQAGIECVLVGGTGIHPSRIHIRVPIFSSISPIRIDPLKPFAALKPLADRGESFSMFLWRIESKSVSQYLTVDPVTLCEEIWELLSALVEEMINECQPQMAAFVSAKNLL